MAYAFYTTLTNKCLSWRVQEETWSIVLYSNSIFTSMQRD